MNVDAIRNLSEDLREDGVVCVRNALDHESLALAQAAFDWSLAHPSPAANRYAGGEGTFYQDLANPKALPAYRHLIEDRPLPTSLPRCGAATTSGSCTSRCF